ncbi:TetR/AcrR family transcriptional regulator [Rhodococcus sp. NPDC058514]|uniref:TetR/AcrR family transcriptional regulator n=1 Tax=unclassified Rhodococcus (in: high G+C Gram-positive bacteria) TaxID=192944 RepID=UPI00365CA8DC
MSSTHTDVAPPVVLAEAPVRRGRPPQPGLSEARRDQILSSAIEEFAERGYEATTAAQLAKRAGVGLGTMYRYFDSKREILDHVMDRCLRELIDVVDAPALLEPLETLESLIARIRSLADALFGLVEDSPNVLKLLMVEASAIEDEFGRRVMRGEQVLAGLVAEVLDLGILGGLLRKDLDTNAVGHSIIALTWPGLLRGLRVGQGAADRARYTDTIVALVSFGLRRPVADGPAT